MVRPVREPHGDRAAPERDAELDDLSVVLDRELAHRGDRGARSDPNLYETDAVARRRRRCPGRCSSSSRRTRARRSAACSRSAAGSDGWSHGTCRLTVRLAPVRTFNAATSSSFSSIVRGSPPSGKRAEARAARPERPRRHADGEARDLVDHGVRVDPVPRRVARAACVRESAVVVRARSRRRPSASGRRRCVRSTAPPVDQRTNASGSPPSTGTIRPVVRGRSPADQRVHRIARRAPGSTSRPSSVRFA